MTVTMTPRVRVGWYAPFAELTSRVVGFSTSMTLSMMRMATATMTVTLRNNDGALTPDAGGTYATVDWFTQPLRLDFTVTAGATTNYPPAFDGIITGFDLKDDGIESTVTLTAVDVFALGGRFKPSSFAAFAAQLPTTLLSNTATRAAFQGYWMGLGGTAEVTFADYGNSYGHRVQADAAIPGITFNDLVNNVVLPGVRGWAWPRNLDTSLGLYHNAALVAGGKSSANLQTHTFRTSPVSGTQLPYRTLKQGWTNDRLVNTVAIKTLRTGATEQVAINTTAAPKYGSRTSSYLTAASETNGQALGIANNQVVRFASPRFQPMELTVTGPTITDKCADASVTSVTRLLSFDWPMDLAELTWRPAGASVDEYARCIVLGRRLDYTYDRGLTITLQLGNWSDNTDWIIDTSMLGYDRLG